MDETSVKSLIKEGFQNCIYGPGPVESYKKAILIFQNITIIYVFISNVFKKKKMFKSNE